MFDQTFVNARAQTSRPLTVAISIALQTTFVTIALIAPILHIARLDLPPKAPILLPFEKVDLKLKPTPAMAQQTVSTAPRPVFHVAQLQAPIAVPRHIDPTPDAPEIGNAATTAVAGPPLSSLLPEIAIAPPPVRTAAVSSTPPPAAVHVGGGVQAAKLIFGPKPAYPPLARITHTQGTVRIQAIIARDGSIGHLQVLSGPPLLIAVALEAVQRWRYQPTLLNGQPVEVVTEIDVSFTLSQ